MNPQRPGLSGTSRALVAARSSPRALVLVSFLLARCNWPTNVFSWEFGLGTRPLERVFLWQVQVASWPQLTSATRAPAFIAGSPTARRCAQRQLRQRQPPLAGGPRQTGWPVAEGAASRWTRALSPSSPAPCPRRRQNSSGSQKQRRACPLPHAVAYRREAAPSAEPSGVASLVPTGRRHPRVRLAQAKAKALADAGGLPKAIASAPARLQSDATGRVARGRPDSADAATEGAGVALFSHLAQFEKTSAYLLRDKTPSVSCLQARSGCPSAT